MIIETLVTGPLETNTYVLSVAPGGPAVVIDPGGDPDTIIAYLCENRLVPTHILITHGHGDHIAAIGALKKRFPDARICVHPRDAQMLVSARANMSLAFGFNVTSPPADMSLEGASEFTAAGMVFRVEHVPGHSPGSICFVPTIDPPAAFVGDTLFEASVGRTDFPGGNAGLLYAGIREKLLTLPGNTIIYPGHGAPTTVAREKASNPFVGDSA